jgi:hypothetical protein
MSQFHPSDRRVQMFLRSSYAARLRGAGLSENQIDLALDHREECAFMYPEFACLLCEPWPPYCPDYDKGNCRCQTPCDSDPRAYRPSRTFKTIEGWKAHRDAKHSKSSFPGR